MKLRPMEIKKIEEKCNNCLLCVRECVAGVWREVDGQAVPVAPEMCNGCSHCVAVCPQEAISHSLLDQSQVAPVDKNFLDPRVYEAILRSRRSIRRYKKDAVPPAVIEEIIDLARYSPTASNAQNVAYQVITDKNLLAKVSETVFGWGVRLHEWSKTAVGRGLLKLFGRTVAAQSLNRYLGAMDYYRKQAAAGRDFILHNAPVLLLLTAPKGASFASDNCNIAATNIINYAHAAGLGTCYIGFLTLVLRRSRRLRRLLGVPADRRVYVSLAMGYPAYGHSYTVSRKPPSITWVGARGEN